MERKAPLSSAPLLGGQGELPSLLKSTYGTHVGSEPDRRLVIGIRNQKKLCRVLKIFVRYVRMSEGVTIKKD